MENTFKFVMPAEISKSSEDGEWRVAGLASTDSVDQQGERIIQKGVDLSPIDQNKGYFNFDHKPGPENLIGTIDGYRQTDQGLYVQGKLFKNHDRAKAVYGIMSSLSDNDRGRVGLSVEGQILERDPKNPKVIKKCRINKVAITMNPVNQDTFADLVKSMSSEAEVEFNSVEDNYNEIEDGVSEEKATFTATQVMAMVEKALSLGTAQNVPSGERSGGDALVTQDKKTEKACWEGYERTPGTKEGEKGSCRKKKMKKMTKKMYKSNIVEILDKLQVLYPENSRSEIWECVKDRINTKYDLGEQFNSN